MKMFDYLFVGLIFSTFMISTVKSDAVCDLNTFIVEVKQDLADNGMLDCLRVIDPPHFVEETEDQKNLRLAAQWDTSCAFESSSNWAETIKKTYEIGNLVDSIGEVVKKDFEDQADLCEILRAAVAKNMFLIPDLNMQKIPNDIIDKIDCAGLADTQRVGPRICAATGGSYFQKDSWTMFLDTSVIKAGGKPEFVLSDVQPERAQNPFANTAMPEVQTGLIKDLMKFSRDQLDNKQGELANMIDKAQEAEVDPGQAPEKDTEHEKTKEAHVHVKRLKELTMPANKKYAQADGAEDEFSVTETRIVFGFYMVSFKFEKEADAFFKLSYANREMPESRTAFGKATLATMTSAFGEVYNPKSDDPISINLLYETTDTATVSTDSGDMNFSFGAITLPEGEVFKKINSGNMEYHKSEKWNPIPNFDLNINFQEKADAYFLVMYNIAFPMPGSFVLETRLRLGKTPILETAANCGPTTIVGSHAGIVLKIPSGTSVASVEYKYNGDSLLLQDFTDAHYVQSITAFQLPESTDVKNFKLTQPSVLGTSGEWKSFGLEGALDLNKKKTLLILYNINLKVDQANFAARIRIDSKYNKKSVFTVKGQVFASAQGYVVKVLKPGKYNFDIDYKSDAQNSFDPSTSELDGQVVNMQLVLFD